MIRNEDLTKYSLFGGLMPEQIDRVIPLLGQERFRPGDAIIREGAHNDRLYFILEGKVRVSRDGTPLVEFGVGDEFGEMEVLNPVAAAATVAALEDTSLATISNRGLNQLWKMDTAVFSLIVMNLARDLSRRLRHMDELAASFKAAASPAAALPAGALPR